MATHILTPSERFHTKTDWLESYHIFNFSNFYRDERNGFGDLLVVNDDYVQPDRGFGMHSHSNMEIVTWVISGTLAHEDNQGNKGTITPGEIQQMSAGSGVRHSEVNPSDHEPVRLLQMWVLPDQLNVKPRYQQRNVEELVTNQLGCIASGAFDTPIHLHNSAASLYVGRYDINAHITLPTSEKLSIYIARGSLTIEGESAQQGTSILIDQAQEAHSIDVDADSEIVVWSIDSHARTLSHV